MWKRLPPDPLRTRGGRSIPARLGSAAYDRVMTNPIIYIEESNASLYEFVSNDPPIRRAWGVKPVIGEKLTIFRTEQEADEFSSQHDQGEVVQVDAIVLRI